MELITSIEVDSIYKLLNPIGSLGDQPANGYFRPAWSVLEQQAFDVFNVLARDIGLSSRYDSIGNLFLEENGYTEYVEAGSHLDTVFRGGNFDGVAGIVGGFLAIKFSLKIGRKRGLRLRIWRGEESTTYQHACKGSRAAFGRLPKEVLDLVYEDQTLKSSIEKLGFSALAIEEERATISQVELDSIFAHLELHIEQANSLEAANKDLGIVTSIRGPSRWQIILIGSFDHSGGTPMGLNYRRDVNLALGYILVAIDEISKSALADGSDLVQTVGVINSDQNINKKLFKVYQNATAKVSGFGYFNLDIRSNNKAFRTSYVEKVLKKIKMIAEQFKVQVEIEKISETDPLEELDPVIIRTQNEVAKFLGYSANELASGALHDCVYLGEQNHSDGRRIPIGMVFIPCSKGISHAPEEFSTSEQIAKGANLLALVFQKLCN